MPAWLRPHRAAALELCWRLAEEGGAEQRGIVVAMLGDPDRLARREAAAAVLRLGDLARAPLREAAAHARPDRRRALEQLLLTMDTNSA
jgi:hypothetical protein